MRLKPPCSLGCRRATPKRAQLSPAAGPMLALPYLRSLRPIDAVSDDPVEPVDGSIRGGLPGLPSRWIERYARPARRSLFRQDRAISDLGSPATSGSALVLDGYGIRDTVRTGRS